MAISLVGTAEGSAANGADVVISLPAGLAQNDLVCVFGGIARSGADAGVSTSGYTEDTQINASGSGQSVAFSWKRMGASPDTSVTGIGNANASDSVAYVVMAFRGVHTSTAIDATTITATGSSSQPNSNSITTATNGAAVISFVAAHLSDTAVTMPSGYGDQVDIAQSDNNSITVGGAWITKATAGAENPPAWSNFTTTGITWDAFTVALRPSASGTFGDGAFSAGSITGDATFVGEDANAGRGIFATTGVGTATFTATALADAPASITGTGTATFGGTSLTTGAANFAATGSGAASFVGELASTGKLQIAGSATLDFSGGPVFAATASMTGNARAVFVGGTSFMTSVREVIESRGAATVGVR